MADEVAAAVRRTRPPLDVRVDGMRCRGHGACVDVAPDVFALDRFGLAFVRPEVSARVGVEPELRAQARLAASRCPVAAVLVRDARPGVVAPTDTGATAPVPIAAAPQRSRATEREDVAAWKAQGGLRPVDATAVRAAVAERDLTGSGGAAFPVAAKWASVPPGRAVTLVANAAEREPGTAKDRHLLRYRPFAVLDGLRVAAVALAAERVVVALDEDAGDAGDALTAALASLDGAAVPGLPPIEVRSVPARYVVGEETALIAALEGRDPVPTPRPPYPTTRGLDGAPTVVHNVETLVRVAEVAASLHVPPRTRHAMELFSVGRFGDDDVAVCERPSGYPLRALLAEHGLDDAEAVLVGGWSGSVLPPAAFGVALSPAGLRSVGARLGTKSIQAVPPASCVAGVVADALAFLAAESAGQCPPCTQGLPYLARTVAALRAGTCAPAELDEAASFARTLRGRGACALPDGGVRLLESFLEHFEDEVAAHLAGGCRQARREGAQP